MANITKAIEKDLAAMYNKNDIEFTLNWTNHVQTGNGSRYTTRILVGYQCLDIEKLSSKGVNHVAVLQPVVQNYVSKFKIEADRVRIPLKNFLDFAAIGIKEKPQPLILDTLENTSVVFEGDSLTVPYTVGEVAYMSVIIPNLQPYVPFQLQNPINPAFFSRKSADELNFILRIFIKIADYIKRKSLIGHVFRQWK